MPNSLVSSKASITHLEPCPQRNKSSSSRTTSSSKKATDSSRLVASTETGQQEEASSTTTTRLSLFGSTKRTSSELSRCSLVQISVQFSQDLPLLQMRSRRLPNLPTRSRQATSHRAQQTWALLSEPLSTYICQSLVHRKTSSRPLQTSTMCRSEVLTESILRQTTIFTTFPTREDSVCLRFS